MDHELLSPLDAPPGGVMTDEVGVITGELELRSRVDGEDGGLTIDVRYVGALDWYRVTGTTGVRLSDPADLLAVHTLLRGVLHRPEGSAASRRA